MSFHHTWSNYLERSRTPFAAIKDHVLLHSASTLREVDAKITEQLTPRLIESIVQLIPDAWLVEESLFNGSQQHRAAYVEYLMRRLEAPRTFLEEAVRARSLTV